MKTALFTALAFGACATAGAALIPGSSAWAEQPQQAEAAPDTGTDKPMVLSEAEMDLVAAGSAIAMPEYQWHSSSRTRYIGDYVNVVGMLRGGG